MEALICSKCKKSITPNQHYITFLIQEESLEEGGREISVYSSHTLVIFHPKCSPIVDGKVVDGKVFE